MPHCVIYELCVNDELACTCVCTCVYMRVCACIFVSVVLSHSLLILCTPVNCDQQQKSHLQHTLPWTSRSMDHHVNRPLINLWWISLLIIWLANQSIIYSTDWLISESINQSITYSTDWLINQSISQFHVTEQ